MEQQKQQPNQEQKNPFSIKNPLANRKLFLIATFVVVVLTVAGVLLFASLNKSPGVKPITYAQCNQLGQEIDALIKQATYCEVDSDCMVPQGKLVPGSPPCSCLYAVNKDYTDFSELEDAVRSWNGSCSHGVVCEVCAPLSQFVKCQENKCVGVWNQDDSAIDTSGWQTYSNEEFGYEVKYPGDWEITDVFTPPSPKGITFNKITKKNGEYHNHASVRILIGGIRKGSSVKEGYLDAVRSLGLGVDTNPYRFKETTFLGYAGLIVDDMQLVFVKDTSMFIIDRSVYGNYDGEFVVYVEQVYNQILSTFRFVEAGVDK